MANYVAASREFGVSTNTYSIDMSAVRDRKRKMVAGLVKRVTSNFESSKTDLLLGSGRFVQPKTIEVALNDGNTRIIQGEKIVLSTGSRSSIDDTPGLKDSHPLTHIEALELDQIPEHLVVLGGGYIGLEFAQMMRRFGSAVTIIDRNERLAHREDRDVSELLHDIFRSEGIEIITGGRVVNVEGISGKAIKMRVEKDGAELVVTGSHILVATGRTPNTDNIGLESIGVELTERGYIKVNERLETSVPDVWAVGDCAGSPHFTHIAFDDYNIVRENLAGGNRVTSGRQVPFCMFTDPELARCGLNEAEARAKGIAYRLAKIPMSQVPRAITLGETLGFMKALIDIETDRILGFTAFGVQSGELIATVQVAMLADLPHTALRNAIFTHPTMMEGLKQLFAMVPNKSDVLLSEG